LIQKICAVYYVEIRCQFFCVALIKFAFKKFKLRQLNGSSSLDETKKKRATATPLKVTSGVDLHGDFLSEI